MVRYLKYTACLLTLMMSMNIHAQEICNNAIDDDGDGLIDLNDEEDCNCPSAIPSGLIPNPSFEDMLCCPFQKELLDECADIWIQASAATSDYLHNCGLTVHPNVNKTAPQPIPDGDGYVGFRDGHSSNSNYKEYVGACLNETMEIGKEYRLDFFLGFSPEYVQSLNMTIFGTTECSNIPFGNGNTSFGCPTNGPDWDQLGQLLVSGQGEWVNLNFDFIADKPYNVIVIGPGCSIQSDVSNNPYFFVDRLALAELVDFDVPFAEIQGDLCQDGLTIIAEDDVDYGYQWYKNGIALIGETSIKLDLSVDEESEGLYEVLIITPDGCFNSEKFDLYVPDFETEITDSICEGETYNIAGNEITTGGSHTFPLISSIGCDSVVNLELTILPTGTRTMNPTICEGEEFTYEGKTFTQSGLFSVTTPSTTACDSLIIIDLTVTPHYELNIPISICEGQTIQEGSEILNTTGVYTFDYTTAAGCDSIITIDLEVNEPYYDTIYATICEGDNYQFGDEFLTNGDFIFSEEGTYDIMLFTVAGCDSSTQLNIEVENTTFGFLSETICKGEPLIIGTESYDTEGSYLVTTQNVAGCDSLIELNIEVIELNNAISLLEDIITVKLGDAISISPNYIAPEVIQIVWTDTDGVVISNEDILNIDQVTGEQNITIIGVDSLGCIDMDQIEITVDRNIGIYTPNIFSPNGDGRNDYFRPVVNQSLAALKEMVIYDRWGNLVYAIESIADLNAWQGWNGKIDGSDATAGVYVYFATYIALDGEEEIVTGDITITR